MNKKRPTPETDAAERIVMGGVGGDWKVVLSDFARNLERERDELKEKLELARWDIEAARSERPANHEMGA